MQLTFNDGHVGDFLEELGTFLQGYLTQIDAVSRSHSYKKNLVINSITLYAEMNVIKRFFYCGFVFAFFVKYRTCDLLRIEL